jgi:hypothetical protein
MFVVDLTYSWFQARNIIPNNEVKADYNNKDIVIAAA